MTLFLDPLPSHRVPPVRLSTAEQLERQARKAFALAREIRAADAVTITEADERIDRAERIAAAIRRAVRG